jgi:hypothetical protein
VTLPVTLAASLAGGLAAVLAGALVAGWTGCTISFSLHPLQPLAQGDYYHSVPRESAPISSWSKGLQLIICIRGLDLRPERWRRGGWLGDVVLQECLRADLAWLEWRPGSLEGSCRLRGRPAKSPSGGLWQAGGFNEVHCLAGVAEDLLELRCLHPNIVVAIPAFPAC